MTTQDTTILSRPMSMRGATLIDTKRNRVVSFMTWGGAVLAALAAHVGLFWYVTRDSGPATPPAIEEPAAVMIDMALMVQQAFSQNDAAVGQPMTEAAEAAPEMADPVPDLTPPVEESPSEAVAPLPPSKPVPKPPEKKPPEKKVLKKKPPLKPRKIADKESRRAADRTASAPRSNEHAARTTAMSAGVSNNSPAAADWRSQVAASINRVKRYPMGAFGTGSPIVRVSVAASGAIVGTALMSSSGNAAFDDEAVAAVHRVGSFPPPPQGATSVPLRLNFRR